MRVPRMYTSVTNRLKMLILTVLTQIHKAHAQKPPARNGNKWSGMYAPCRLARARFCTVASRFLVGLCSIDPLDALVFCTCTVTPWRDGSPSTTNYVLLFLIPLKATRTSWRMLCTYFGSHPEYHVIESWAFASQVFPWRSSMPSFCYICVPLSDSTLFDLFF